jgi:hypothetical protein
VTQGVGSEFKPQDHKKRKRKKKSGYTFTLNALPWETNFPGIMELELLIFPYSLLTSKPGVGKVFNLLFPVGFRPSLLPSLNNFSSSNVILHGCIICGTPSKDQYFKCLLLVHSSCLNSFY